MKLSIGPLWRLIFLGWYLLVKGGKLGIWVWWLLGWHQTTLFSTWAGHRSLTPEVAVLACSCSSEACNASQFLALGVCDPCFLILEDAWLSRVWIWLLLQDTCPCSWGMTKQILHPLVASCQPVRVNATSSDRLRRVDPVSEGASSSTRHSEDTQADATSTVFYEMSSCFFLARALGWLYKEMETEWAIRFPPLFLSGQGMLGIAEWLAARDSSERNIKNEDIIFFSCWVWTMLHIWFS